MPYFLTLQDALQKSTFESYSSKARDSLSNWTPDCIGFNLIEAVLCHICRKERSGGVLVFMTGWDDISCLRDQLKAHPLLGDPNRVLLLTCHGSMATSEQVHYSLFSTFVSTAGWSFYGCFHLWFISNYILYATSSIIFTTDKISYLGSSIFFLCYSCSPPTP